MIDLDFDKVGGLLPAIVQDADNDAVLMLGFMDHEALQTTLRTGRATFFSRDRKSLWTTFAHIVSISVDRDRDSVLLRVRRSDCDSTEPQGFSDTIDWSPVDGDEALRSGADSTWSTGRCSDYSFHC
jgi:phosphoribosyl-AMP cyclohydrolase